MRVPTSHDNLESYGITRLTIDDINMSEFNVGT